MPKPNSSKKEARTQNVPSQNGAQGSEKERVSFLSLSAAPKTFIAKDGSVQRSSTLKIAPRSGKRQLSSDITSGVDNNQGTIIGAYVQHLPLLDHAETIRQWFKIIWKAVHDWEITHEHLSWWSDFPGAVDYLSKAHGEKQISSAGAWVSNPEYKTVAWLRSMSKTLCKRAAHVFYDFHTMTKFYRAAGFNIMQFVGYGGNTAVKTISKDLNYSLIRNNFGRFAMGWVAKDIDSFLISNTRFASGVSNRETPIFLFPLWKDDLLGNDWYKAIAHDDIMNMSTTLNEEMTTDSATPTVLKTVQDPSAKTALGILFLSLQRYCYPGSWPFESPKPSMPKFENLGKFMAEGKDKNTTGTANVWVDVSNTGHQTPKQITWGDKNFGTNITANLVSTFLFYEEYLDRVHGWAQRPGSDMLRIMTELLSDKFEKAASAEDIVKALQDNKNRDLNSLLEAMKYSDSALNTSTIMKYSPFWFDTHNNSDVDIRSDIDVTGVSEDVFSKNFERYSVDDEETMPADIAKSAELWPHLNPSVFVDSDGRFQTVNGTPTLGYRNSDDRDVTKTGVVRSFLDSQRNIELDATLKRAEFFMASEKEAEEELNANVEYVVTREFPSSGRVMHQPLFDKSDPVQGGIFLLVQDNPVYRDIWSSYLLDLESYASSLGTNGNQLVDKLVGTTVSESPSYPVYQDNNNKDTNGAYLTRMHVANPNYLRAMKQVFVYMGLNVLFNPEDITAAHETAYLCADYSPVDANAAKIALCKQSWDDGTSSEVAEFVGSLNLVSQKGDLTTAEMQNAHALVEIISRLDNSEQIIRLYVTDPAYGPVMWNLDSRSEFMSLRQSLPQLEAFVNPQYRRNNVSPELAPMVLDLTRDDSNGNRVNPQVELSDGTLLVPAETNPGDVDRQYDFFNMKMYLYKGYSEKVDTTRGYPKVSVGREMVIKLASWNNQVDFSLGTIDVSNVGASRKLPWFSDLELPDRHDPAVVETEVIPPDHLEIERKTVTVFASNKGRPSFSKMRSKTKFVFSKSSKYSGQEWTPSWKPKDKSGSITKPSFSHPKNDVTPTSSKNATSPNDATGDRDFTDPTTPASDKMTNQKKKPDASDAVRNLSGS